MRRRKWQKPRKSTVAARIIAAYAAFGAMTVSACAQATGIHPERVRRVVRAPQFVCVDVLATVPPARVWEWKGRNNGKQTTPAQKVVRVETPLSDA
jgi:hypothetical protein